MGLARRTGEVGHETNSGRRGSANPSPASTRKPARRTKPENASPNAAAKANAGSGVAAGTPPWQIAASFAALAMLLQTAAFLSAGSLPLVSNIALVTGWLAIAGALAALVAVSRAERRFRIELTARPGPTPTPHRRPDPEPAQVSKKLAYSVSHELRTPLNAMIGFSDMMKDETFGCLGHPKYREYCAHIQASGTDMLRAVDEMIALNAVSAGFAVELEPVCAVTALEAAWQRHVLSGPDRGTIRIIATRPVMAMADSGTLERALASGLKLLSSVSAPGSTLHFVIRERKGVVRIHGFAPTNGRPRVATAPLLAGENAGAAGDSDGTLCHAVTQAYLTCMNGTFETHDHADEQRFEIICRIPSAQPNRTATSHESK